MAHGPNLACRPAGFGVQSCRVCLCLYICLYPLWGWPWLSLYPSLLPHQGCNMGAVSSWWSVVSGICTFQLLPQCSWEARERGRGGGRIGVQLQSQPSWGQEECGTAWRKSSTGTDAGKICPFHWDTTEAIQPVLDSSWIVLAHGLESLPATDLESV